jgi:hypothetical protein
MPGRIIDQSAGSTGNQPDYPAWLVAWCNFAAPSSFIVVQYMASRGLDSGLSGQLNQSHLELGLVCYMGHNAHYLADMPILSLFVISCSNKAAEALQNSGCHIFGSTFVVLWIQALCHLS